MVQFNAKPSLTASSIAFLLITGNVPGNAKETGLTCVLGSAPKAVKSLQKSLVWVCNCACTSRPTTSSYFAE